MKIIAEQEHYLLVTDGHSFTVVERRAGKFYPLRNGSRTGVYLDDDTVAGLIYSAGATTEKAARNLLADVASQWRDLFEHVR